MSFLSELHSNICETIKENIPEIITCCASPKMRLELIAPAVFVELESLIKGSDPGTEELSLIGTFEARLVLDRTIKNAELSIRELAINLAYIINKNTWNTSVSPAKIKDISQDCFKPELDAFLVWCVTWAHEFHIGENVWNTGIIQPHNIIINSEESHIGEMS